MAANTRNGGSFCSAVNCRNYRGKRPDLSFFRFPKDKERCLKWVQGSQREDLQKKNSSVLRKGYYLCAEHFESSEFMNENLKNKLKWSAVPTLFQVPNPPKPLELEQKSPKHHLRDTKLGKKAESTNQPEISSFSLNVVKIEPGLDDAQPNSLTMQSTSEFSAGLRNQPEIPSFSLNVVKIEMAKKKKIVDSTQKVKKLKRHNWTMEDMRNAIQAVHNNKMSVRKSAKQFNVPRSTLQMKLEGKSGIDAKLGRPTKLKLNDEKTLIKYACQRAELGIRLGKKQFLSFAKGLAAKKNVSFKNGEPSDKWWRGLKKRHPDFTTCQPEPTISIRHQQMNEPTADKYFSSLKQQVDVHDCHSKLKDIWNLEESGFQIQPKRKKHSLDDEQPNSLTTQSTSEFSESCVMRVSENIPNELSITQLHKVAPLLLKSKFYVKCTEVGLSLVLHQHDYVVVSVEISAEEGSCQTVLKVLGKPIPEFHPINELIGLPTNTNNIPGFVEKLDVWNLCAGNPDAKSSLPANTWRCSRTGATYSDKCFGLVIQGTCYNCQQPSLSVMES